MMRSLVLLELLEVPFGEDVAVGPGEENVSLAVLVIVTVLTSLSGCVR